MPFFLPLIFLMLLACGCVAFFICSALPFLRRFALPFSLWMVACFPCLLAAMAILFGIAFSADQLQQHFQVNHLEAMLYLASHRGLVLAWFALISLGGATVITLAHGLVIRRLTLALFRLYITAVAAGVGLSSIALLWIGLAARLHTWWALLIVVSAGVGLSIFSVFTSFRHPSQFRGTYPERFPLVTKEEFG
jgi:hypothetical protein